MYRKLNFLFIFFIGLLSVSVIKAQKLTDALYEDIEKKAKQFECKTARELFNNAYKNDSIEFNFFKFRNDLKVSYAALLSIIDNHCKPTIEISLNGLDELKVGKEVESARIVYTLTNGEYVSKIVENDFKNIERLGLPKGLKVGSVKRSDDKKIVTVSITGTPQIANEKPSTIKQLPPILKRNVDRAEIDVKVLVPETLTVGKVALGDGAKVSDTFKEISRSSNSITMSPVSISGKNPGKQIVEYTITIDPSSSKSPRGWQTSTNFVDLDANTTYYVWARSKKCDNYDEGKEEFSQPITTKQFITFPTITVTSKGLDSLKVGKKVSSTSIFYTLNKDYYYSEKVTDAVFINLKGLPLGLTASLPVERTNNTVTVTISGTPENANPNTTTIIPSPFIPKSNIKEAKDNVTVRGNVLMSAVAKGDGAKVSIPEKSDNPLQTEITVKDVSLEGVTKQLVEYAITETEVAPKNDSVWSLSTKFENLKAGILYIVWARSRANDNYNAGSPERSEEIRTAQHNYTISASKPSPFDTHTTSYTQPEAQIVTVTNTGTDTITLEQPTSKNYIIGTLTDSILYRKGETATFTVRPKAGLAVGNHDETITVIGSHDASASVNVSFTVNDVKTSDPSVKKDSCKLEIGIFGSAGGSKLLLSKIDDRVELFSGFCWSLGVDFTFMFNKQWSFRTGLYLTSYSSSIFIKDMKTENEIPTPKGLLHGSSFKSETEYHDYKECQKALYIRIPMMAQVRWAVDDKYHFIAATGPIIGFRADSKYNIPSRSIVSKGYSEDTRVTYETLPHHGFGNYQDIQPNEKLDFGCLAISWALEAGMKWKMDKMALYGGVFCDLGHHDVRKKNSTKKHFEFINGEYIFNSILFAEDNNKRITEKVQPRAIGLRIVVYPKWKNLLNTI